jgi:hypothetical protein
MSGTGTPGVITMRLVLMSSAFVASLAFAADPPQHRGPPQEALTACSGLNEGSACGFTFDGKNLTGQCRKGPNGDAAACLDKVRFTTDVNEILALFDRHLPVAEAQMNTLLGESVLSASSTSKAIKR